MFSFCSSVNWGIAWNQSILGNIDSMPPGRFAPRRKTCLQVGGAGALRWGRFLGRWNHLPGSHLSDRGHAHAAGEMTEKFAPAQVFIRRYTASEICEVVVLVRSQEMVLQCPNYPQALKWARLECKSYKIPQPDIEPPTSESEIEPLSGLDHEEDLPLFLRSSRSS